MLRPPVWGNRTMGIGEVEYPISSEVRVALNQYKNIAIALGLPCKGTSALEVVRLLDNCHYADCKRALEVIDAALAINGSPARQVLQQKDPFQFDQALSELHLFVHLSGLLPGTVQSSDAGPATRQHDLSVDWEGVAVCIEVYSPIDFFGFQLLDSYLSRILKYVEVDVGFTCDVHVRLADTSNRFYANNFGTESEMRSWLGSLAGQVGRWITGGVNASNSRSFAGASDDWHLEISIREIHENPRERLITFGTPTRSSDTRLFFEIKSPDVAERSEWGKKLRAKLAKRQCGDAQQDKLRLLIVDFSHADTGWPDFICWPDIALRMEEIVRALVQDIGGELPYEIVLPAQIGFDCGFGPAIGLANGFGRDWERFSSEAGLDQPVLARE